MLEISSMISKDSMKKLKLALVDFMYRFKDKIYKYTLENGDIYRVYYEVMDFMRENKLKPSIQLQEEYKQAPINNISFPDFETLHEEIGMSETVYSNMMEK